MKGVIQGFFKWVLAGIELGVGVLIVIMALFYFDTKDENQDAVSNAKSDADMDNRQESNNDDSVFTSTFIADDTESLSDEHIEPTDEEMPVGYSLNDKGHFELNNPIDGSTWETIDDENVTSNPRVYMPLTVFNCITDDDEMVRVDVVNSDIGFMLKYYFATPNSKMNLQLQQPTEESYYTSFLNGSDIVMRAPDYFYRFAKVDGELTPGYC